MSMCDHENIVVDKWALVTGGSSGLGRQITKYFARKKYNVLIACRNSHSGEAACRSISVEIEAPTKIEYFFLDLAEISSIRMFVRHVESRKYTIAVLVNNAAVYAPLDGSKTNNGQDMCFGVNYVAPFYLTNLLLPTLIRQQQPCKIINIGCGDYVNCPAINFNYVREQFATLRLGGFLLIAIESARGLTATSSGLRTSAYVKVCFRISFPRSTVRARLK